MQIIKLNINELKPYKNNAKSHTKQQIEQIKSSIERFGNVDPIGVWSKDNVIVEGHGRYLALKELGYSEVECIRLDHLSDEERKAYALIHNQTTMNTGWDFELLHIELDALSDFEMGDFGFYSSDDSYFDDFFDEPQKAEDKQDDTEQTKEYKVMVIFADEEELQVFVDKCKNDKLNYEVISK